MKVLSTEQQVELQEFLEELRFTNGLSSVQGATLNYWSIELKPKRVRKKNEEKILTGMSEALTYAENVV